MGNTNTNWVSMSDNTIVATIGEYVKHQRLAQNKTQAQVAKDAGVNRYTLGQFENGVSITMSSFIQILRALDLLHLLDVFKQQTQISPIALAKLELQKRQRARQKGNSKQNGSDW